MYLMDLVVRHGRPEARERYLHEIGAGRLRLQSFAITEPDAGSDTSRIRTAARRRPGGGWVVNGQKIWTSRVAHSDLMLLVARTTPVDEVAKHTDGISLFLVDLRQAGDAVDARPIGANQGVQFPIAREYDVERKFRDTRLYTVAPIANNLVLAYLGQHVLGMPKSY